MTYNLLAAASFLNQFLGQVVAMAIYFRGKFSGNELGGRAVTFVHILYVKIIKTNI